MSLAHNRAGADMTDDFVPLGTVEERIPRIDRDKLDRRPLAFVGEDGFEARIPFEVVERMVEYGRRADPSEWLAILVGRIGEDGSGRYVAVRGAVLDDDALARPGYVETSPQSEAGTRTLARTLYPDCSIVGWAHGHVRCGARFSAKDLENQRSWTRPHSLGIVVDPWDPARIAVYRGPGAEKLRLVGHNPVARATNSPASEARPTVREESLRRTEGPVRVRFVEDAGAIAAAIVLSLALVASAVGSFVAYRAAGEATADVAALCARVDSLEGDRTSSKPPSEAPPASQLACGFDRFLDAGEGDPDAGDSDVAGTGVEASGATVAPHLPRRVRLPAHRPAGTSDAGADAPTDSGGADSGPREASAYDAATDSHSTGHD